MNPVRNNDFDESHGLTNRSGVSNGVNNETTIERTVMRRVRIIRILALIISTATLAVLTTVAGLWGIGKEVWVAQVLQNDPDNIFELPWFYLGAFWHTSIVVQMLILLTLVSFIFLVREFVRFLAPFFTPARSQ